MITGTLADRALTDTVEEEVRRRIPRRGWRSWAVVAVTCTLLVPGVWFLRHNQEHANAEFDATRRSLDVAQHQLKVLRADLSWLRQDLGAVKGQVRQSTTALSTYTAQFHQAQAALARVRSQLSTQGTDVAALQSCLGGVEQALNALSVGDGESAVGALRAVSSSCESALGSDG